MLPRPKAQRFSRNLMRAPRSSFSSVLSTLCFPGEAARATPRDKFPPRPRRISSPSPVRHTSYAIFPPRDNFDSVARRFPARATPPFPPSGPRTILHQFLHHSPVQHPPPPFDRVLCHRRDLASRVEARHMTETQPTILTDRPHPPSFLKRQRGSMTDYDRL